MARNVEIKARVHDLAGLEQRAAALAAGPPRELEQEDLFFVAPGGRLKLRSMGPDRAELIYYQRPDTPDPSTSDYEVVPVTDAPALGRALTRALGTGGTVRKRRRVYLVGQTRVHLDQVEQLGDFMELEVVLRDDQTEQDGVRIAQELMRSLGVEATELVDTAYVDLLETKR